MMPSEDSPIVPGKATAAVGPVVIDEQDKALSAMQMETGGTAGNEEEVWVKGEPQPPAYRDFPFAVLFVCQVIAVAGTAFALGPAALEGGSSSSSSEAFDADEGDEYPQNDEYSANNSNGNDDEGTEGPTLAGIMFFLLVTFLGAAAVTMLFLNLMVKYSHELVKISFFVAPASFGLVAFLFLLAGDDIAFVFAIIAVAISALMICFYFCYRAYMPFAASNLRSALSAIRMNSALYVVAFGSTVLVYLWTALWSVAVIGVYYKDAQKPQIPCSDLGDDDTYFPQGQMCDQQPNVVAVFFLLLCFYWSQQVIQNVLHVTTAGTVGSWWFSAMGDGSSWCSRDVTDSLHRAVTYSFGSICLGSLLVALVQALEQMIKNARRNRRGGALILCVLECIAFCLRAWLEYFNSWAFVYVGLYGYDYITAGKNVVTLFRQRGWTSFITDRLVFRVLLFCNVGAGVLSGCVAVLVDMLMGSAFTTSSDHDETEGSHVLAFFVGLFLGLAISGTALFVVESAVRTVIVCFAESPAEFDEHHPDLCAEMTQGWSEAYPSVWSQNQLPEARVIQGA